MPATNSLAILASVVPSSGAASPDLLDPSDCLALDHTDRETIGQFVLRENYPNPFVAETTVPFTLATASDVRLDIFDLLGRKLAGVVRKNRSAGLQSIKLNLDGLGLPTGDYEYRLQVTNSHGVFSQRKLMTAE